MENKIRSSRMKADEVLQNWGSIATYLEVSEKTAMRYEKRGLPIERDPAGHPFITKQAADKWKFNNKAA
jgi:hypothetical protein